MPVVHTALLCSRAERDERSRYYNLTAVGLRSLFLPRLPLSVEFCMFVQISDLPDQFAGSIRCVGPGDTPVQETSVLLSGGTGGAFLEDVWPVSLVAHEEGVHQITLSLDGVDVASRPLEVLHAPRP